MRDALIKICTPVHQIIKGFFIAKAVLNFVRMNFYNIEKSVLLEKGDSLLLLRPPVKWTTSKCHSIRFGDFLKCEKQRSFKSSMNTMLESFLKSSFDKNCRAVEKLMYLLSISTIRGNWILRSDNFHTSPIFIKIREVRRVKIQITPKYVK